jgi:hypothetical protein
MWGGGDMKRGREKEGKNKRKRRKGKRKGRNGERREMGIKRVK